MIYDTFSLSPLRDSTINHPLTRRNKVNLFTIPFDFSLQIESILSIRMKCKVNVEEDY